MIDEPEPIYQERDVAEILGLSRDEFRHVRSDVLKKKKEWRLEGRDVVLTATGLEKILAHLKAVLRGAPDDLDFSRALVHPLTSPASAPEKNGSANPTEEKESPAGSAPAPNDLVQLTVRRVYPNFRLLQAATPAGELVDVRVRNNQNFVPKMTLQARLGPGGKYEMEGRCPRFRGRY